MSPIVTLILGIIALAVCIAVTVKFWKRRK